VRGCDWLCVPRFDSAVCFAALLGTAEHGRCRIAPRGDASAIRRRYRDHTLVLETETTTPDGVVRVLDCMQLRSGHPTVLRVVEGVRGRVPMTMELVVRFDYGGVVPCVRRLDDGALSAVAGPDALCLRTRVEHRGEGLTTRAEFTVGPGERVPFSLAWHASHRPPPAAVDACNAVAETESHWRAWCERSTYDGEWGGRRRGALAARAEGARLRSHRHRRRADDVAPGNFPQAFTHVSLVNTARNLSRGGGPAHHRAQRA